MPASLTAAMVTAKRPVQRQHHLVPDARPGPGGHTVLHRVHALLSPLHHRLRRLHLSSCNCSLFVSLAQHSNSGTSGGRELSTPDLFLIDRTLPTRSPHPGKTAGRALERGAHGRSPSGAWPPRPPPAALAVAAGIPVTAPANGAGLLRGKAVDHGSSDLRVAMLRTRRACTVNERCRRSAYCFLCPALVRCTRRLCSSSWC
jgi:hypothetical protein